MALCAGGVAQYWISAATDGRWLIDSDLWVNMECDFLMVFFWHFILAYYPRPLIPKRCLHCREGCWNFDDWVNVIYFSIKMFFY